MSRVIIPPQASRADGRDGAVGCPRRSVLPSYHEKIEVGDPYTKADLVEYADLVESELPKLLDSAPLDADSGFEWIPFSRFELHLYNLRHTQHHAGQLIERLRTSTGNGVDWIGHGG